MNIEEARDYCLSKLHSTESCPFGPEVLVFKIGAKMFAAISLDDYRINLKGDPEKNIDNRERYEAVIPGWHMNKKHWNTVYLEQDVSKEVICQFIDESYDLVLKSLPKKQRAELGL